MAGWSQQDQTYHGQRRAPPIGSGSGLTVCDLGDPQEAKSEGKGKGKPQHDPAEVPIGGKDVDVASSANDPSPACQLRY